MVIMSIDLGKARTGIAICDRLQTLATPLCVIEEYNRDKLADKIAETAAQKNAELLILGLPKNMDGSEGESAAGARAFAQTLRTRCEIPVELYDERCTTMLAYRFMNESNVLGKKRREKKRKETVDSAAAAIILQSYIEHLRNSKEEIGG